VKKILIDYFETRQYTDEDVLVMDFFITTNQNEMFDLTIEVNSIGYYTYKAFRHDSTPCNLCFSKSTCHCNIQEMDEIVTHIIEFKGMEYAMLDRHIYEKYLREIISQLYNNPMS